MKELQLTYRAGGLSALAGLAVLALASGASAQAPGTEPPVIQPLPPEPPPPTQPAPAPPPQSPQQFEPMAPPAQPPPVQPPPVQPPPVQPDPLSGQYPAPPPMAPPPPPEEPAAPSGEGLRLSAFVDANYGFQTQRQGTPVPVHRAYAFNHMLIDEQEDVLGGVAQNGFSLSWVGVDATYDGGQLGATISLRAGSAVPIFYGGDTGPFGIDNVTQAFATWTPVEQLSIDFGQFGTIFGAEVAESWRNLNYTRGGLYFAMQPFWHTGMRATFSPNEKVAVTGMVVNGVNTLHDDNETPSLGLQLSLTPNDALALAAGWLTTIKPSTDGSAFDNFFDLVASLSLERFTLIFNADLTVNGDTTNQGPGYFQTLEDPLFWGVSLAAGYQATDMFGLALRGEYLSDSDNQLYGVESSESGIVFPATTETNVVTVTGTLDFKPVRGSNNLIIRWDNRIETSNEEIFFNRSGNETEVWFGSVLGVVVTTDG